MNARIFDKNGNIANKRSERRDILLKWIRRNWFAAFGLLLSAISLPVAIFALKTSLDANTIANESNSLALEANRHGFPK